MLIGSILLYIVGAILIICGVTLNNDPQAQFESLLANGSTNPGTVWIIVGVVLLVVATVLLVLYILKKVNKKSAKAAKSTKDEE